MWCGRCLSGCLMITAPHVVELPQAECDDVRCSTDRPLSVTKTLKLFLRQHWRSFRERERSAYGLPRTLRSWTELEMLWRRLLCWLPCVSVAGWTAVTERSPDSWNSTSPGRGNFSTTSKWYFTNFACLFVFLFFSHHCLASFVFVSLDVREKYSALMLQLTESKIDTFLFLCPSWVHLRVSSEHTVLGKSVLLSWISVSTLFKKIFCWNNGQQTGSLCQLFLCTVMLC